MEERIPRNGGIKRVDGHLTVRNLHVVTNVRILTSDILCEYPTWWVALHVCVRSPWRLVAIREISQHVAGWVRRPNSERRGPHSGSGWRTKANNAENVIRLLVETDKGLLTHLDAGCNEVAVILSDNLCLLDERRLVLDDLTKLRRDLDEACLERGRNPIQESELAEICWSAFSYVNVSRRAKKRINPFFGT